MLIKGVSRRGIAVFAPNEWTGPWMNRQQLFSRIAKTGWPVSYSTGRANLWNGLSETLSKNPLFPKYNRLNDVLVDHPSLVHMESGRLSSWNRFTLKAHAKTIQNRLLDAGASGLITYLFHPLYEPYIDALNGDALVLHLYDALFAMPGWTTEKQAQLVRCARRADLIITSSKEIQDGLPPDVLGKAETVENGADVEAFNNGGKMPLPKELQGLNGPLIGCCGVMSQKTDIDLLHHIAVSKPEWTLVLIGPYFFGRNFSQDQLWQQMTARANVQWLGLMPPDKLPRYVGHMDINLIPYRVDDPNAGWARYCFPLKLHEYLATGKAVISSKLPPIEKFANVLSFANDYDDWIRKIESALHDKDPQIAAARIATASANSWDIKAQQLSELLDALPGKA